MEIVLGVSMTPTTVSIALVEGEKADGVIVEHDVFDITAIDGSATSSASDHVIAAVLGTQEGAIAAGHHLVSTGVTWTDHADAAVLREALVARGIEDVLLVSELHAAAALAQAVGRAVGYDTTALMFVERDTATLAVGSRPPTARSCGYSAKAKVCTVRTRSRSWPKWSPAWKRERSASRHVRRRLRRGRHLGQDKLARPGVGAGHRPHAEPQLALPRGAALASASAPRFDTSTVGLAYSQDPATGDASVVYPLALAGDATTFLGHADASTDTADIASDPDDVPERSKPFLLVGSSLTAIFVAGMMALAIAMVTSVDRGLDETALPSSAVAPPPAVQSAPAAPQPAPKTVPGPAPSAPRARAAPRLHCKSFRPPRRQ